MGGGSISAAPQLSPGSKFESEPEPIAIGLLGLAAGALTRLFCGA
jgi:hypothetical protein